MNMKVIVWSRPDGGISVTYPAGSPIQGETEDQFLDRIAVKAKTDKVVEMACIRQPNIDPSALPARDFRDAWVWSGSNVIHDVGKAKVIQTAKIETEQNEEFKRLQVEQLRVIGDTTKTDAVEVDLQTLRDMTVKAASDIAKAKDIGELKAIKAT